MTGPTDDKRRSARAALTTYCPANFDHGGTAYHCIMLNISEYGAGFSIDDPSHDPGLEVDDELRIEVLTPYGSGTCRGVVIWSRKLLGRASWGIKFTAVSDDPEDAFRALIDAPF